MTGQAHRATFSSWEALMNGFRAFLMGWFGLVLFLGAPLLILVLWPSGPQGALRWAFVAPIAGLYAWAAWPRSK